MIRYIRYGVIRMTIEISPSSDSVSSDIIMTSFLIFFFGVVGFDFLCPRKVIEQETFIIIDGYNYFVIVFVSQFSPLRMYYRYLAN